MSVRSITELPNELTADIDIASPLGIVRLLRASDAQMFAGYRGEPALVDDEIVERVVRAVDWARDMLGRRDAVVVLSGAGTSGRLAMFVARTFNRALVAAGRTANVAYRIAGGDRALIRAQEGAEDDPHVALSDLDPVVAGKRRVLYVGITCGLSAPYVASQIDFLSRRRGAQCILLGFNPQDGARDVAVEKWNKTFADVVRAMTRRPNCLLLNPVVGPEPITGSTRMKGGSATKLLLETVFAIALQRAGTRRRASDDVAAAVRCAIASYDRARLAAYEQTAQIADLVSLGGDALRHRGHIYYVGTAPAGILGLVDASECPPTFGADFDAVRGFVAGGWRTLLGPGHDLRAHGRGYRIDVTDFLRDVLPTIGRRNLVVAPAIGGVRAAVRDALRRSRRAGAKTAIVQAGGRAPSPRAADVIVHLRGLPPSLLSGAPLPEEFAIKLVLNALTTGAHVRVGKVYRNRMIDLRISNNKLYHRAIGIVQAIACVSADAAKRCVLRGIYGVDRLTPALLAAPPSRHVDAATNASRVMPRALILAVSRATCAEADAMLRREPVVRAAIERLAAERHTRS